MRERVFLEPGDLGSRLKLPEWALRGEASKMANFRVEGRKQVLSPRSSTGAASPRKPPPAPASPSRAPAKRRPASYEHAA